MDKYEITHTITGKSEIKTGRECNENYGKARFKQILKGHVPTVTAVKIK